MWESSQQIRELQCELNERREVIVELINPKSKEFVLLVDHLAKLNTDLKIIDDRIGELKKEVEHPTDGLRAVVDSRQREYSKTAEHIASLELVLSALQTLLKAKANIDCIDTALLSSEYDTAADLLVETTTALHNLPESIVDEIRDFDLLAVELKARKAELTRCLQDTLQTFFSFDGPQAIEVYRSIPAEYSTGKVLLEHVWFAYRQIQGLNGIMERLAMIVLDKLMMPIIEASYFLKHGATIKHEVYQAGDDRDGWSWTVQIGTTSQSATKKPSSQESAQHTGAESNDGAAQGGAAIQSEQLDELAAALQSALTFFQSRVFHPSQEATESFGRALWPQLTKRILAAHPNLDMAAADTLKKFELTMKSLQIVPVEELHLSNFVDERVLVSFNERRQNALAEARADLLSASVTQMTVRVSDASMRKRITGSPPKAEDKHSAEEPMLEALMSVVDWTSAGELPVSEQEMELNFHSGEEYLEKDPELRYNFTHMPKCSVSIATDRLVKVIQQLHTEAAASLELGYDAQAESLFSFSKELAMLFMALRPTSNKHLLAHDPTFIGLFYSDCLYLSNILAVSMYSTKPPPSCSSSTGGGGKLGAAMEGADKTARRTSAKTPSLLASRFYFDLVVSLNALQRCLFTAFLKRERNFIWRSLASTAGEMGVMSVDSNYSFVEMTLTSSLQRIHSLASAWLPVLPMKTYLLSVGILVEVYLNKFLENIFRLPQLAMRNTSALSHAIEAVHTSLENILALHVDWYVSPSANRCTQQPTPAVTPGPATSVQNVSDQSLHADAFTATQRSHKWATASNAFDALDAADSEVGWGQAWSDASCSGEADALECKAYLNTQAVIDAGVRSWDKYRLVMELLGGDYSAYVLRADAIRQVLSSAELKRLLLLSEEKLPQSVSESIKVISTI